MQKNGVSSLRNDPLVRELLERMPEAERDSFSDRQLQALKSAIGSRRLWTRHAVDLRGGFSFWTWRYYFVILGGRERRRLTRKDVLMMRSVTALVASVFFLFSLLFGLLILYLLKSALGINLLEGYSFGIWQWFNEN